MDIEAEIKSVRYTPTLCKELEVFHLSHLADALEESVFLLDFGSHPGEKSVTPTRQVAVSRWVSPKRTRSYPFQRVYETLGFSGKRITVIPVYKDEGKRGDRDFIQWDTISLMSLLQVHVIVAYYITATKSNRYCNKITAQALDSSYVAKKIQEITSYQSCALHWNVEEAGRIGEIAALAKSNYERISSELNTELHGEHGVDDFIRRFQAGFSEFQAFSRQKAKEAQIRESITTQPMERIAGEKATITIKNLLGGHYYLTCDEAFFEEGLLVLVEAKHTSRHPLPNISDIKDGLIKMMLFTSIREASVNGFNAQEIRPMLKLTSDSNIVFENLSVSRQQMLRDLKKEALCNSFDVVVNGQSISDLQVE